MADKQIVLVAGSNGQLGSELQELAPAYPDFAFIFSDPQRAPIK